MKKIRYFFESVVLFLMLGLSKFLPTLTASNLGGWIGRTIGPRLAASRKARANLKMVFPDKTDNDREKILIGMWDNLGRVMMEYSHIEEIAKKHTQIIGIEIFKKNEFTAPIFISAHIGNWEICPPAFWLQTGIKVNPVYRAPNNPIADKMLNNKRSVNGALTPIPKSRTGTRMLVKTLQNGEGIGLLIDQKYNEGMKTNFFGHPAMTAVNFAQLSQKFNCPVIPLRIERIKGIDFRITVSEPIDIANKSIEEIITQTHSILEEWITEQPEQWLWLHRRWMTNKELNDKRLT